MDPKRSSRAVIWFIVIMLVGWGVIAFALGMLEDGQPVPAPVNEVASDRFILTHTQEGDTHSFSGTVEIPTPCHGLGTGVSLEDGPSPSATIAVNIIPPEEGTFCAQVISQESFAVSVMSGTRPEVLLSINGRDTPVTVVEGE